MCLALQLPQHPPVSQALRDMRFGELRSILPPPRTLPAPWPGSPLPFWVANSLWEARNKISPSLEALWVLYLVTQGLLCCGCGWHVAGSGHGAGAMQTREGAGTMASSLCPPCLHPWPPGSPCCTHGRWRMGALLPELLFWEAIPAPRAAAGLEQRPGEGGLALRPCLSFPSPSPAGRTGPARLVWLRGRPRRTRGGSSGLCDLSGAGRLPTAGCPRGLGHMAPAWTTATPASLTPPPPLPTGSSATLFGPGGAAAAGR